MSNNNMVIWGQVEKTDKRKTKPHPTAYVGAGKKQTTIDGYSMFFKRATNLFGPFGYGWGVKNRKDEVWQENEKTVLWKVSGEFFYLHDGKIGTVPLSSIGELISWNTSGYFQTDISVSKKAYTDIMKKGLSMLGFCADVFSGHEPSSVYTAVEWNPTNMSIWNNNCGVDHNYLSDGERGSTNIKPYPTFFKSATSEFGPFGIGWGLESTDSEIITFDMVGDNDKLYTYKFHILRGDFFYHLDKDKILVQNVDIKKFTYPTSKKIIVELDAYKKSVTGFLKKMLSYLGFVADLFDGSFEDDEFYGNDTNDMISKLRLTLPDELYYDVNVSIDDIISVFNSIPVDNTPAYMAVVNDVKALFAIHYPDNRQRGKILKSLFPTSLVSGGWEKLTNTQCVYLQEFIGSESDLNPNAKLVFDYILEN